MRASTSSLIAGLFAYLGLAVITVWLINEFEGAQSTARQIHLPDQHYFMPVEAEIIAQPATPIRIRVDSAYELEKRFEQMGYHWPPAQPTAEVPPVELERLPPDLYKLPLKKRKALFFSALLPLVLLENRAILYDRLFLRNAFEGGELPAEGVVASRVEKIANYYRVKGDLNDPATRKKLMRRVDVVPVSLALAQAANESAWGTSRFAIEANNLFGQWIFGRGPGIVPENRPEGATYRVRLYPNLRASVRSYLRNINIGHAYRALREERASMRRERHLLDGMALATGLTRYSTRGEAYVTELQQMIAANKLQPLRDTLLRVAQ